MAAASITFGAAEAAAIGGTGADAASSDGALRLPSNDIRKPDLRLSALLVTGASTGEGICSGGARTVRGASAAVLLGAATTAAAGAGTDLTRVAFAATGAGMVGMRVDDAATVSGEGSSRTGDGFGEALRPKRRNLPLSLETGLALGRADADSGCFHGAATAVSDAAAGLRTGSVGDAGLATGRLGITVDEASSIGRRSAAFGSVRCGRALASAEAGPLSAAAGLASERRPCTTVGSSSSSAVGTATSCAGIGARSLPLPSVGPSATVAGGVMGV